MIKRRPSTRRRHRRERRPHWRASESVATALLEQSDIVGRVGALGAYVSALGRALDLEAPLREIRKLIAAESRRIEDWAWITGPPESDTLRLLRAELHDCWSKQKMWMLLAERNRVLAMRRGACEAECEAAWQQEVEEAKTRVLRLDRT